MFPSIATVSLSGTLREKIDSIAKAGYKHIEIFEADLIAFDGTVKEAAALVQDYGLKVITLQPFRDFEGLEGKDRQLAFKRAELKFDQMEILDTDLLMVCSSLHPRALGGIERLAADIRELGEMAAKRNMRIAYEALAWGKHVNDYRDSWEIVRRADHPSVGLVLDSFHIFSRGTPLTAIENIPGDRIFLVQTADAPSLSMDHLSWSRHFRCFPGQGELDIASFMETLCKAGYTGPVSHEIFNDVFRKSASLQTAEDGYRSSRYLASMLPENKDEVPAPSILGGFDFIEISTQPQHLESLHALLTALGFHRVGKHRTMDAEHWQCADVHFVLNADPAFANEFLSRHGTGVVALGLKVDNTYACSKRADFLDIPLVKPGQAGAIHHMVGMQNVDGTVWYWVDPSASQEAFDSAFEKCPNDLNPSVPFIKRIDHLSLSQSYPDYLSTLLSFRSMFRLHVTPAFDVFDPQGLIQSQVVCNDDSSFQLAFNASDAQSTTSARFMQRAKGSGVQHIALKTEDIFTCAQSMRDAEIRTLTIPPNYYPDVQSRFGLDAGLVNTMAAFNILYDEDENGFFFQFYTLPIDGKFSFEIVQRNGYKGLGAANAALRTAAQQHSMSME